MTDFIHLPAARLHPGTVALPGSKSISNRTLLLAALADNDCEIVSLLHSDDILHMRNALEKLGVHSRENASGSLSVQGCHGHFPQREADLFLGHTSVPL